jgi:hypothetical protein
MGQWNGTHLHKRIGRRKWIPPPTTYINEPVHHRLLITELPDLGGMRGKITRIGGGIV